MCLHPAALLDLVSMVNQQRLEQLLPKPRTDHSTQTRSLRSRSRIDWAVEAARWVRSGLVAALKVDGFRGT